MNLTHILRDTIETDKLAKSCIYVPSPCTVAKRVAAFLSNMHVPAPVLLEPGMKELETWTGTILLCGLDFLSRSVHVEYLNTSPLVSSVQHLVADDGITTSSKLVDLHTC